MSLRKKTIHLKAPVLVPLVLASTLVLIAFVVGLVLEEDEHTGEDFARGVQVTQEFYQKSLDERAHKLEASLDMITGNVELLKALKSTDRVSLFARAQPLFQRLMTRHDITHFYFHSPQRVNLLRVHQPERYGDTIARFTILAAEQSGEVAHGVELGPLGTFTLRAVAPVREGDQLLGYIELGEEVDSLIGDMAHFFEADFVVTINKHYLKRTDWEAGMRMFDREMNWDHLPNSVIASKTLSEIPAPLTKLLIESNGESLADGVEVTWNERHLRAKAVALHDVEDRVVGKFLMVRDMTLRTNSNYSMLFSIVAGALLLGGLLFTFLYGLLGQTERKILDDQVKIADSEQRMRLHYERTPLGVIEWNTDFEVVDWNPAAERIFGYSKAEALGSHAAELIIPESARNEVDIIWESIMSKAGASHQINDYRTKSGQIRSCEWYNTPLVDEDNKLIGVASLVDDITERKKVERLKNDFIATVSHELRTPLTSIRGSLGLLLGGVLDELPNEILELITIASNNTEGLLRLINNILDVTQIESGELRYQCEEIEIPALISDVIKDNKAYFSQYETKFEYINQTKRIIKSDKNRITQVLNNLLSNAAKFSPKGSVVTIISGEIEGYLRISIIDFGPGIPKTFHAEMFEKFTQSDNTATRKVGGCGLGLYIAKQIVDNLGGRISFETDMEKGTVFHVDLPLAISVMSVEENQLLG